MFLEYVKTRLAANASREEALAPASSFPQLPPRLKTILEKEFRHSQPRLILEVCNPYNAAAFTVSEVLKAQNLASWVFSVCRSDGLILPTPQPIAPGLPIGFGEFSSTLRTNGCDNVVPPVGDIAEVRDFFMLYEIAFDLVLLAGNKPLIIEELRTLVELMNDQGFIFIRDENSERQRQLESLVRFLLGCAAICGEDFSVLYKGRVGPSLDRVRSNLFADTPTRATYNHLLNVHETVPLAPATLDAMMKETGQKSARIRVMEPVELNYDACLESSPCSPAHGHQRCASGHVRVSSTLRSELFGGPRCTGVLPAGMVRSGSRGSIV